MSEAPALDKPRELDDVMLAMDVVDTLRHRARLVESELASDTREVELVARLKDIYAAQGISVSDAIIKDGVRALEEKRFVYEPPKDGFAVRLARFYVARDRWLKPVLAALALAALAAGVYEFGVAAPQRARQEAARVELGATLPAALEAARARALARAAGPAEAARIDAAWRAGSAAIEGRDAEAARAAIADLELLALDLHAELTVRIVSRAGEYSGVFRIPDDAPEARNYYLIVEAVDAAGRPHALEIVSEEDRAVRRVESWGVRVPEAVFNAVAADKRDDQIIENAVVGAKPKGALAPRYDIAGAGGAILEW
jgi:hypothetical protein